MKKISIIGTVGVPANYGGFETLIENLLPSDLIGTVYCSSKSYSKKMDTYKGVNLQYIPLNANGIQSIPYDVLSILHSLIFTRNDFLVLGVSGAFALPLIKLFSKRRVVTNIDGLEWKRDKWGKFVKWFLKLCEGLAVKFSDNVVADNEAIASYVQNEYGILPEIIAYGGDHAIVSTISDRKAGYALGLCRIEPENNVEMILEAFASESSRNLKFVGNWANSKYGVKLKAKYSLYSNIELIDPIYDLNALFELRSKAEFYLHGHSAGGTNPSLVEMMFFGIPIYCFDCNYNRASTEEKAIYFKDSMMLAELISQEIPLSNECMLEIASRRYTWELVKSQYESLF